MNIYWFRRDLRLNDNKGLLEALQNSESVLPIFIFDVAILNQLPKDDARVTFIHKLLSEINAELQKTGKSLAVFYGDPIEIFKKLISENSIQNLYANRDYEPYARKRDKAIYEFLASHNIEFKSFKDQVIFEKSEVTKNDGLPYVVYTPYSRKWKENFKKINLQFYNSENHLDKFALHSYPFLSLQDIGFETSSIIVTPFNISGNLIQNYEATRNFPALNKTSYLGAYLRFGAVSIRKMIEKSIQEKNETFWNELIWREFFMQILWHYPHTSSKSFR